MLRHTRLLLLALGFALALTPAHAATQTLTILGANGVAGSTEPNTDYSKDGGVTWHPAYLFTGHPWGYISGTNAWLNQNPSPFVGLNERVDFRIRFYLPADFTNATMTYQVNADNEADILLNGTPLVHTVGGPISSGYLATQYLVPGINIVYVRLIDYGGWVGLNYRLNLTVEASSPIQLLTPPPSITSALTATGQVGAAFSYSTSATNSPSSFSASGLPAGLAIDPASGVISGTPTVAGVFNVLLTASSTFGSGSNTLTLTVNKGAAIVTLGGLTHTYDGSVKSATATTSPADLAVAFTYTGASVPPVNAGNYTVFGVVNDTNYAGSASAALVINPAALSITLGNLTQDYDGAPKPVSATTSPDGVALTVTYNGSTTVPSAVGTYAIAASSPSSNYLGSATGTLVIRDVTPPVLTLPANLTLEATGPAGAVATFAGSALDDVSGTCPVTFAPNSGSTFPLGTTNVSATAADAAGNQSTDSFTVTVQDTTAPVLTAPADIVIEATGAAGAVASYVATASDLVSGAVEVTSTHASGSTFPIGTTPVTLTATDAAGNVATQVFTVTVADTTAPVIAPQDNLVVEATGADGATVSFTPSALDIVSGAVGVTASPASGSVFPLGVTTVTLTALDAANNTTTATFTVTVQDTTAPSIAPPAAIAAEATSAAGASVTFEATATDLVDGAVAVTASPASGSVFPIGTTTVTLTAVDAHGNVADRTFTVTVADTTAPVLTVPASQTLEATSAAGAVATYAASATDAVGATVIYSIASGSTFPLGTTNVTVTATDPAGNQSVGSFTITVADTTPPVLTVPANLVVEATGPAGATVDFAVSASDAVGASLTYSVAPGSVFPIGTTSVLVTAADAAGHVVSQAFNVTVQDTTAPALTLPGDLVVEATSADGARVTYAVSALDLVGGTRAVSVSRPSGSRFPLGVTTVTATAVDTFGNTATGTFTVTVRDTTAPTLRLPGDLTVKAKSAAGAKVYFVAFATDAVDRRVQISYSVAPGSVFPLGATTVTVTATDDSGNVATGTFIVTVVDHTKPEFIKLSVNPSYLTNGNHQMVPVTVTAIAKDAIDPSVDVRIVSVTSDEPVSGTGSGDLSPDWEITGPLTLNLRNEYNPRGNGRIYTIAVTATDDSGNTRTRTLHVIAAKRSGVRFEDCDDHRRSESQRCDDDDRDWHGRDHGDDDDND